MIWRLINKNIWVGNITQVFVVDKENTEYKGIDLFNYRYIFFNLKIIKLLKLEGWYMKKNISSEILRENFFKKTFIFYDIKIWKTSPNKWAQLAGAVEYTDCISAEG